MYGNVNNALSFFLPFSPINIPLKAFSYIFSMQAKNTCWYCQKSSQLVAFCAACLCCTEMSNSVITPARFMSVKYRTPSPHVMVRTRYLVVLMHILSYVDNAVLWDVKIEHSAVTAKNAERFRPLYTGYLAPVCVYICVILQVLRPAPLLKSMADWNTLQLDGAECYTEWYSPLGPYLFMGEYLELRLP